VPAGRPASAAPPRACRRGRPPAHARGPLADFASERRASPRRSRLLPVPCGSPPDAPPSWRPSASPARPSISAASPAPGERAAGRPRGVLRQVDCAVEVVASLSRFFAASSWLHGLGRVPSFRASAAFCLVGLERVGLRAGGFLCLLRQLRRTLGQFLLLLRQLGQPLLLLLREVVFLRFGQGTLPRPVPSPSPPGRARS
jgi:hypothetical protein